jgi:GAF domain-containing protein
MTVKEEYFKTFCAVSRALGTTLGKEALLELIVESAIESMGAKAACLFLADQGKDIFMPVVRKGLSDNYLHAKPIKARKLVSDIMNGGYLHFRDATSDPRLEHHELKKAEGIASILSVPVQVKDKTIGILSLYTAQVRDFEPDEIEFLSALAEQGGMAIDRARLFDRVNRNAELFRDLSLAINASLDIKKIVQVLTEGTCKAFGMKGVSLFLINEETGGLDRISSFGLSQKFLLKGPLSSEKSITEALRGATVAVSDVATDNRIQYQKAFVEEGIASMLCVPIKSREAVVGVMRLYSGVARQFPRDFIMTVEAVAHAGALAIQNASMYLRLEEDKTMLEKDIWVHRAYF